MIRRGRVTAPPKWFQVVSVLPAPPSSAATSGIALVPGRYVLVSVLDANGALRALAAVRIG